MQSWRHESAFAAEYMIEEHAVASAFRDYARRSSVDSSERNAVLYNTTYCLRKLQVALLGHEVELSWVNQLLAYVQQLQVLDPAQTAEAQFNYLYQLRKWLFWIPASLLQRESGHGPALLTLAHFYATSLVLEPLFPDLGPSFCSVLAVSPLEAIIRVTDAMQSQHGMDPSSIEIGGLMQFPRQTAINYRSQASQRIQPASNYQDGRRMLGIDPESFNYGTIGNLSPAFTPSTPAYNSRRPSSTISTAYLEVPMDQASFTYGTQTWGAMPSPGFPPQMYTAHDEQSYDYGDSSMDAFRGGFVQPTTIWI